MVKRKKYFLNPISRQNFAYAFAETPNLNLEVRRNEFSQLSPVSDTFPNVIFHMFLAVQTVL